MATMVRKQIYIEPQHEAALKHFSTEAGLSEAEVIRQALASHLRIARPRGRDLQAWAEELRFIDALIQQGPVEGGRQWQREELYER